MTIPSFRQNLFSSLATTALLPRATAVGSGAPRTANALSRQSAVPVKSQATVYAERQATDRAREAAAQDQRRRELAAAESDKVKRQATADAVWTRVRAGRDGQPGINVQAGSQATAPAVARSASASIWAKARAHNAALEMPAAGKGSDASLTKSTRSPASIWARARAANSAERSADIKGGDHA